MVEQPTHTAYLTISGDAIIADAIDDAPLIKISFKNEAQTLSKAKKLALTRTILTNYLRWK